MGGHRVPTRPHHRQAEGAGPARTPFCFLCWDTIPRPSPHRLLGGSNAPSFAEAPKGHMQAAKVGLDHHVRV